MFDGMDEKQAREAILEQVAEYCDKYHKKKEYREGDRIPYASRVYDREEMVNLVDSSLEFWLTSGHYTDEFESKIAEYLGVKYCSFVNSGSSANLLAFMALTSPLLKDRAVRPGESRGVCEVNAKRHLTTVVERTEIIRRENGVCYKDGEDWVKIEDNTPVSMNVWGFTPDYMKYSEDFFKGWLKANINVPKSEYFIPLMVNELINNGTATVEVLDTTSKWFGVTYADDRQGVVDKIAELVKEGVYPAKLFA